jgi:hypothetical protein
MGFDAGKVVEPLDYTFEPHTRKHGTIKEPNDRQIGDFLAGIKTVTKTLQGKLPPELIGDQNADVAQLLTAVEDLDPETVIDFHASMAGLFAVLCSGDPSREDLLELPIRVRVIFYGWLQQEVMSPEAVPGGGNAQVVTMPRKAAG